MYNIQHERWEREIERPFAIELMAFSICIRSRRRVKSKTRHSVSQCNSRHSGGRGQVDHGSPDKIFAKPYIKK